MGCEPIYKDGKLIGFTCGRGRKPQPKCYICGKPATTLCDHSDYGRGHLSKVFTCDRPMCDEHRHNVGKYTDYCDEHYEVYKNDEFRKSREPQQLKFE